jgi:membrane associated rhomboid family serine protease
LPYGIDDFMFPLRDDNPTTIFPIMTISLIALNVIIFGYQMTLTSKALELLVYQYGAIPAVILGTQHLPETIVAVPPFASLFTSMFLHGGVMHLLGNMLYLWIFGNNIEEAMGRVRFVIFYLITGMSAIYAQILSNPNSIVPTIGASGAISGILGAYILLYPRARVLTLVFLGFFVRIMYIPAGLVLGIWFAMQVLSGSLSGRESGGGVAFWAHAGGFLAGMLLVGLFKRREIRFFNPPTYHARMIQDW